MLCALITQAAQADRVALTGDDGWTPAPAPQKRVAPLKKTDAPKPEPKADPKPAATPTVPRTETQEVAQISPQNRYYREGLTGREYVSESRGNYRGRWGQPLTRNCLDGFIDRRLELGPYGEFIKELIEDSMDSDYDGPNYGKAFLQPNALAEVCPNYKHFDQNKKIKAQVWFFMALAQAESGQCHPLQRANIRTPKPAIGMFMLESRPSDRRWRGPMCWGNIRDPIVQLRCAVHTMWDFQMDTSRGAVTSQSYWEPLTTEYKASRLIRPHMTMFPGCYSR